MREWGVIFVVGATGFFAARLGAATLGPELGPFLGFPRSASVRATSDVVATAYSPRVFREKVLVFRQPGALPPAALNDLLTQVKALDMDEVRAKVAEHQH